MAPFLTAGLVAMQTMERGNITAPDAADADDRRRTRRCRCGRCGRGGCPETIIANRLLEDTVYTGKVATMTPTRRACSPNLGSLFNGMSGLGATMDLMTAFTTPPDPLPRRGHPGQVNQLIRRFGAPSTPTGRRAGPRPMSR